MKITKKVTKGGDKFFSTDKLCSVCNGSFFHYDVVNEKLQCHDCNTEQHYTIQPTDECVGFFNPNAIFPEPAPTANSSQTDDALVEQALSAIKFPIAYTDWLRVGFSLVSVYGARRAADMLYRCSAQAGDTVQKYERILEKADGRVGIGTLFAIAKEHGFRFPTPTRRVASAERTPSTTQSQSDAAFRAQWNTPTGGVPTAESYEPTAIESAAQNLDVLKFDKSIVPKGLPRLLFDYFTSQSDAPAQFHFVSMLATLAAVAGSNLRLSCRSIEIKPNDYFCIINKSGSGKTTALTPPQSLLEKLEKRVLKTADNYENIFLFPSVATQRGLLDIIREPSQAECEEHDAAERKGKGSPKPLKKSQRSGVAIIDEMTSLFDGMKSDFNAGLDSTILLLWDGTPRLTATSAKNDGKVYFKSSAVTLLGASTPKKFRERLPQSAYEDGLIARLQFCFAADRAVARKPLTALASTKTDFDEIEILDALTNFFSFVARLKETPVRVSADAARLDEKSVETWFKESQSFAESEAALAYYQRIDVRKIRYGLLFAACEAFERNSDVIVLTETAMQSAINVCDFFKAHSLHFISKSATVAGNGTGVIEKKMNRIETILTERFGGVATERNLAKAVGGNKKTYDEAFASLVAVGKIIQSTSTYRGQPSKIVTHYTALQKTASAPSAASAASAPNENKLDRNTSETTNQNLGAEVLGAESPLSNTLQNVPPAPRLTELEQSKFDAVAKPALVSLAEIAKRVDADLSPVQTIPETDEAIEAALESLPDADSVTRSLIAAESEAAPVLSDNDFQDLLLASLPQKFSWYELRAAVSKFGLSKEQADAVGMKIWKERGLLLKLADTPNFIKSHDRPAGFEGLVAFEGVLPCAEPEPF